MTRPAAAHPEPLTDHDRIEGILSDLACDFAQFGALILAVGGLALLLFAFTTA